MAAICPWKENPQAAFGNGADWLPIADLLLEQFTMAAGTTGHGAGLVTQLRHTRALTDLSRYAADLYSRLEAETGQPTGFKQTGSITVARTQGRADEIKRTISMAKGFGVEIHSITPREAGELWPLMNTDDVVGAIPVHLICGIWGTIAVVLTNGDASLGTQLYGIIVVGVFTFIVSAVVWFILKMVMGIRVSEEEEITGLDMAELGMEAYPEFSKG